MVLVCDTRTPGTNGRSPTLRSGELRIQVSQTDVKPVTEATSKTLNANLVGEIYGKSSSNL